MKKCFTLLYVLLFLFTTQGWAQNRTISGLVTSAEDGSTMPGVTVMVKGTTVGTVTDINGKYSISVPSAATTLVFSYVGMQSQEIAIEGRSAIDVKMSTEVKQVDEVLVVGYGSRLKTELTGSISKVQAKEIENLPVPTFEGAMQGRTAGVFIENTSGKLGEAMRIRIRGNSSISADNQPLYVVDGMVVTSQNVGTSSNSPTNPMADLNPADIESINILKDASAAAIYGSRAANGVVLITTKRGKAGKTQFNFGYQVGVSTPTHMVDMMNGQQYRDFFTEVFTRSYGTRADAIDVLNYYINYFSGYVKGPGDTIKYDTNWQKEAFQRGSLAQYELSAAGGNDKTQFFTGLTYNTQNGILLHNQMDRISGRVNIDHQPNEKLKLGMNFSLAYNERHRVPNDNAFSNPLQMIALPPVQPIYDPENPTQLYRYTLYENGLRPATYNKDKTTVIRNLSGAYLAYEPFKGFVLRAEAGVDILAQREMNYMSRKTVDGAPTGYDENRALQVINWSTSEYFTYNKDFAEIHNIELVGGITYQQSNEDILELSVTGFPSDDFQTPASGTDAAYFSGPSTGYKYMSYFSRLNYKLSDRYLFGLSGRMDGSSRFGANHKYGFFPAVSAGWILSREKFLEGVSALSFLKVRASYGLTGNSEIDNFASLGLYSASNYAGLTGIHPSQLPSPDLKWETTAQTDAGIDFGFLKNRITGEIDVYYKKTKDLLLYEMLPATSGYTSRYHNVGSLENKGLEFVINTNNLVGAFQWSTQFNIGFNKNKILNINGPTIYAGNTRTGNNIAMEGQPMGVFYLPKYAGVDPQTGDALYYVKADSSGTTTNYNEAAFQIVGDPNPKYYGGITNTFTYKGFDLSFLFQFVGGNKIFKSFGLWAESNGWNLDNQTTKMMKAWKKPGDITDVPRADWDVNNGTRSSSRYIEDGSYLRLKTLTFGYNLPPAVASKLRLSSLRIYLSGANLLTFTKYTGWDPEVNYEGTGRSTTNTNLIQGSEFYTAPQAKTFTLGLKVGF